jgi:hypothetical protein
MKKTIVIILIISFVLAVGLFAAGCVQSSGTDSGQPSANQPQAGDREVVPAGEENTAQNTNPTGDITGTGSQRQPRGPGFLTNASRISAAAAKLGVSEDLLRTALNASAGGRSDLNGTAQKLGVTQAQLADALGIPAGGFSGRTRNNVTPSTTI